MDGVSFETFLSVLKEFGAFGFIAFMWWVDSKNISKVLAQYREDMNEQRRMYENNAELVRKVTLIAEDLKDIVIMNTQAWIQVKDGIYGNQFCPMVRLEKSAMGVVQK
jgi:hypothetical protein